MRIEIRDFPKRYGVGFPDEQSINILTRGLESCVHLQACTWTRDGSLTSEILTCLAKCPELTDVAINGGYSPHYEPADLVQLFRLRKISLIMPCIFVVRILPHWLEAIERSLTSLSLICKARFFCPHPFDYIIHQSYRQILLLLTASYKISRNLFHSLSISIWLGVQG